MDREHVHDRTCKCVNVLGSHATQASPLGVFSLAYQSTPILGNAFLFLSKLPLVLVLTVRPRTIRSPRIQESEIQDPWNSDLRSAFLGTLFPTLWFFVFPFPFSPFLTIAGIFSLPALLFYSQMLTKSPSSFTRSPFFN